MSSNMQDMNHAFQMAETMVARTVTNPAVLDTNSRLDKPVIFNYTSVFHSSLDSGDLLDASSYYRGEGLPKGDSFAEINSLNTTALHVFHVETVGKYNKSVSKHAQGVTIVGPKTN